MGNAELAHFFREQAESNFGLASEGMKLPDFDTNVKTQVTVIVGHVKSAIYDAFARTLEEKPARASNILEASIRASQRAHQIRMAGAKAVVLGGEAINEFNKLFDDIVLGNPADSLTGDGDTGGEDNGGNGAGSVVGGVGG